MSQTWQYPERPARDRRRGGMTGRDGVVLVVASAVLGGFGTLLTGGKPGALLGSCIVVGTLLAALTVQPRVSYVIVPVPALAYPVAAIVAGYLGSAAASGSRTALALGALQWIARGFLWMVVATALAVVIAAVRRASFTRPPRRH